MDMKEIIETIVSNLPSNATVNINVAQPGAPIYNNFGGAQFIGSNPSSRKKKAEAVEEPKDAIQINLSDDDETDNDSLPFDEGIVISQSGSSSDDDNSPEGTTLNSNDSDLDIDALIDEAVNDKGLKIEDSASLKLWAAENPTKLQDALIFAEEELEADDGVDDIYTCLKNEGWSK